MRNGCLCCARVPVCLSVCLLLSACMFGCVVCVYVWCVSWVFACVVIGVFVCVVGFVFVWLLLYRVACVLCALFTCLFVGVVGLNVC